MTSIKNLAGDIQPSVAVLLATNKFTPNLPKAIASLDANHTPLHLWIVDDACTPPLAASTISSKHLVTIIRNDIPNGLAYALNVGLEAILQHPFTYIARMDDDDICAPLRIDIQVAALAADQDLAFIGSAARLINEDDTYIGDYPTPTSLTAIKAYSRFNNPFIHPSLMFRATCLRSHRYDPTFKTAQDYELTTRLLQTETAKNLPDTLINYRISSQSLSTARRRRQIANRIRVQLRYADYATISTYLGLRTHSLH